MIKRSNKTIKFFISSTFKDFLKERNALQNFVFPRLKKLCDKNSFYFQPVDLRWGVTSEQSEDNQTMQYCINEVSRCSVEPKPNLLILLGQRYGWGPLPSSINPDDFKDVILEGIKDENLLPKFEEAKIKWQKEIEKETNIDKKEKLEKSLDKAKEYVFKSISTKELVQEWYEQDNNDIERKYFLKPKKNLNSYIWRLIEKTLKDAIQNVEDVKTDERFKDYHLSATELEIRHALEKQYTSDSNDLSTLIRTQNS